MRDSRADVQYLRFAASWWSRAWRNDLKHWEHRLKCVLQLLKSIHVFNRSVGCCNKISGWQFNRLFAGLSKSDQDTIFLVEGIYLISSNLAVGSITACGLGRSALRETLAVGKSSWNQYNERIGSGRDGPGASATANCACARRRRALS